MSDDLEIGEEILPAIRILTQRPTNLVQIDSEDRNDNVATLQEPEPTLDCVEIVPESRLDVSETLTQHLGNKFRDLIGRK